MKSETFRKQALSLIVFFVAIAAVFALHPPAQRPRREAGADHPDRCCFPAPMPWNRRRTIPYHPPASRALCRWMTAALRLSIRHSSGIA